MPRALPRRILDRLPPAWRKDLGARPAERVTAGMSGAEVYRLPGKRVRYLKFGAGSAAEPLAQEIARTAWLAEQGVRVPRILRAVPGGPATLPAVAAMLTEALPGVAAAASGLPPERLLPLLGRALACLHALPAPACPFDETLPVRLGRAARAIARGDVSGTHFASRNRRLSPRTLLARLETANPLRADIVVAHGDATLDNMIVDAGGAVGFIDCGHAGRADRYLDLAVTADDIAGRFGPQHVRTLTGAYGIARWNVRKAAYYADLYELF
jgi:aminoglycoside phosphotransferase